MKGLTGAILIAAMVFAGPAFAQFYKYLDKQGVVRFTDDINQVPQDQRSAARSYSESQAGGTSAAEAPAAAEEEKPAPPEPPAAAAVDEGKDPIEDTRARLDALKKEVEAEYQLLVKEKDRLAKKKGAKMTREETNAYNKDVEAFNQRAESLEKKNTECRKLAESYNTLVNEANAKAAPPPKK